MRIKARWKKEPGWRLIGSRPLDSAKSQAPGIACLPDGGFRLFYTAVGPAKPFPRCQGYILSAYSQDGLEFVPEPGIRVAPQPERAHMSRRLLAPAVTRCADGRWRMYFEARGTADLPTVICSALSEDMLDWKIEEGIRLQGKGSVRAPRYLAAEGGVGRLYCCGSHGDQSGILSARSEDGLGFELEAVYLLQPLDRDLESGSFSAAEVVPPQGPDDEWTMFYSAWQDAPPGAEVPPHPSLDSSLSEDFAAASIASDMAGFRSRIYSAYSSDGIRWERGECVVEGAGYGGEGVDAVHAEDMALVALGGGSYRMYYAACDKDGNWGVASALSEK